MSLWRYTAIEMRSQSQHCGEIAGDSADDVRASLRRIGLQVIDMRPLRATPPLSDQLKATLQPFIDAYHIHLRRRRGAERAELYDSLSTMLSAGLPLLEAIQTLIDSRRRGARSAMTTMLIEVRERLKSGESLADSMASICGGPGWFDEMDVAMVRAGQHGGNLAQVLASMAQRHQKANELGQKLVGALAYPFLVTIVGLGVVVFLSVKTLPELARILTDAKIEVPALTERVMWLGQLLANHWLAIGCAVLALVIVAIGLPEIAKRFNWRIPRTMHRRWFKGGPRVLRTIAVGRLAVRLSELLRSGVPMVEAIRVVAPTVSSLGLRQSLTNAAERLESGDELATALDDQRWFDAEFRRLLDIGQTSGELDTMLQRIGERYQRQAQRLIDRLTALLEPLVILCLAVMVGVVVMAAILPLLRLQEIL
jgi:general secretion pathway protein F